MPTPEVLSAQPEWKVAPPVTADKLGFEPPESDKLGLFKAPIAISANQVGDVTEYHARLGYPMDAPSLVTFLDIIAPIKGSEIGRVLGDWVLLRSRSKGSRARFARHMNYDGWPEFVPHGRTFLDVVTEANEQAFLNRVQASLRNFDYLRNRIPVHFYWKESSEGIPEDHPLTITVREAIIRKASEARPPKKEPIDPWSTFSRLVHSEKTRIVVEVVDNMSERDLEEFTEDCVRYRKGFVAITPDGHKIAVIPYNPYGIRRIKISSEGNSRISAIEGKWYVEGDVEMEGETPKFKPDMTTLIRHKLFVVPHLVWRTDQSANRVIDIDTLFMAEGDPSTGRSRDDSLLGLLMLPYFEESLTEGWPPQLLGRQVNGAVQVPVYAIQRKEDITQKTKFLECAEQYIETASN